MLACSPARASSPPTAATCGRCPAFPRTPTGRAWTSTRRVGSSGSTEGRACCRPGARAPPAGPGGSGGGDRRVEDDDDQQAPDQAHDGGAPGGPVDRAEGLAVAVVVLVRVRMVPLVATVHRGLRVLVVAGGGGVGAGHRFLRRGWASTSLRPRSRRVPPRRLAGWSRSSSPAMASPIAPIPCSSLASDWTFRCPRAGGRTRGGWANASGA